ncbi:MAG: HD family hydrolase [Pseudomonadota bacterium]
MPAQKTTARAWQRMLSGRRLDLLEPSPLDVEIADIAHGLARVARWNGQTHGEHAFTVAQHSVIVWQTFCKLVPKASPEEEMITLLHDAPEYVIGDMISPFKAVLGDEYKGVEARLQEAIHLRYSLPAQITSTLKSSIKKADSIAAYFEATELAGFDKEEAKSFFGTPRGFTKENYDLVPKPANEAQSEFLAIFQRIERKRRNNGS